MREPRGRLERLAREALQADALRPLDGRARRLSLRVVRALRGVRARLDAGRGEPALSSFYPGRPLLLGHRGAMAVAPENTLGAFRRAVDDGGDGVELDVQLSRDDVPIVLHDDTLDRTTDGRGLPIELSADELARLDAGSWFPGWGREKVPTLDEVLAALPDGAVCNVELKGPTPRGRPLERAALEVIARHRARVHVVVSSFHPLQLLVVRRLDETVPIALLLDADGAWPLRTAWPAAALLPEALHPPASIVDEGLVIAAHKAGMRVHVWAARDDAEAERVLSCGADGLIVDDVASVARVFRRRFPNAVGNAYASSPSA